MSCVLTWSSAPRRVAMAMVCLALVAPAAALAQQPASQRPFRGLFGGNAGASDRPQSLDLNASMFAAYDDDIFARGGGPRPEQQRLGGTFLGGQVALSYQNVFPTSAFSAGASTALRWLTDRGEFVPTIYGGNVAYFRQLGPRTSLTLAQAAGYNPRLTVAPFPGVSTLGPSLSEDMPVDDFEVDDVSTGAPGDFGIIATRDALVYRGQARLSRALSARSNLGVIGSYALTDFRSGEFDGVSNRQIRGAGRYSYAVTRYLSARAGYGYRAFRTRTGGTADSHDLDVGLNYGRPFTFGSQRTQLSFTTGTAIVGRERLSGDSASRYRLRAVGSAILTHAFVAPWQAHLRYARTIGFIDGLTDPYSGDQVTASLGGLIGQRTDILASVGYLSGAVGVRERNFTTTLASARARVALTSTLALFAQYFYYQYDFKAPVAAQLGVAPTLERQGVRGGLTVWLPLLR